MRRTLVVLVSAWLAINLVAGWVSITRRLPADLRLPGLRIGPLGADTVLRDWMLGPGAGLAVPGFLLAIGLLAIALGGRLGVTVVGLVALASLVYLLGQTSTAVRLQPAGATPEVTGLLVANLVLSVIIVLAAGVSLASGTER